MALTAWNDLLGLPLDRAQEKARAAGVEPVVVATCAPRRRETEGGTLRVIRVRESDGALQLTVSAFMDGEPRKE